MQNIKDTPLTLSQWTVEGHDLKLEPAHKPQFKKKAFPNGVGGHR